MPLTLYNLGKGILFWKENDYFAILWKQAIICVHLVSK